MRFPDQFLDDVKQRLPLSKLVGRKLSWDTRKSVPGKGIFWACCPFHGEKTPSFRVDDGRGRYHCFGCAQDGDHFAWLMAREGMDFAAAVTLAAGEAGLELPKLSPEQQQHARRRASVFDINKAAAAFFAGRLASEQGITARGYLSGRGIVEAEWQAFGLGFAPNSRSDLYKHLSGLTFAEDDIVAAGLARDPVGSNLPADYFFGRLMFPIRDAQERVTGFAGRALSDDQQPKYLNTPEGPAFSKGRLLYNIDQAHDAARDLNDLILVEGYLDVMALARAGIVQTVAPMGTAVTADQLQLAWRLVDEPVLCLDSDMAGAKAMARAISTALPLLKPGKSLGFATLDGAKDPDEFLTKFGAEALSHGLKQRKNLSDVLWHELLHERDQKTGVMTPVGIETPERRAKFKTRVADTLAAIADDGIRKSYEGEMGQRLKALWKDKGVKEAGPAFAKGGAKAGGGGSGGSGSGSGGGVPDWGPDECARMNQHYAVVITGQRTAVLSDHPDDLADSIERLKFINVDAFRQYFSNRRARVGTKLGSIADLWLDDYHRRQFKGLWFGPEPPGVTAGRDGFFNLWRGFVVAPKANPELAQLWLDHVHENLAGGDIKLFEWIVSWFAWMVQFPRRRSGVSLVLRGGQGAGKTITGKIVGALFAANYHLIDDPRFLTGQFNSHLASCLFLQADEGFWAGDKQAEGRLKGLVTSEFQMIEYKGVDPVRVANYVNLMVSSNADWVVPAGHRERRFAVIDCTARRLQDNEYFGKLEAAYASDDGKAALLAMLATWKIDEAVLRKVPATEALFSQKVRTFDSFTGWLLELLQEGGLEPGKLWPDYVETNVLHKNFLNRAERLGHRHPLSIDSFGRALRRMIPGIQRRQDRLRHWCYVLPGLDVCRDDFCREVDYQIDWAEGGEGGLETLLDSLGIPRSGDSGGKGVNDF